MTRLSLPTTRRTVLRGAALGGVGAAVPLTAGSAGPGEVRRPPRPVRRRPNVIVVSIDDLGWDELGCYGNTFNETPRIDRLAAEGTRFTQAYSAAPLCSPSRAALVTGQYPGRTGITDYLRGEGAASDLHLSTDLTAIPAVLRPRGYTTGLIGKWHLTETYSGDYRSRPGNPYAHGFDEVIASEQLYIGGGDYFHPYFFMPGLPAREPGEHLTDRLAWEAVDFVRRHRDEPFFLHVSNYAVHTELDAEPELLAKYEAKPGAGGPGARPQLAAMLESVDRQVGRIVDELEAQGIAGNTLLLITSDNGGPNRPANEPLRGSKGQLYEGGIRVPLIAWWPGSGAAGQVTDELASTIDVLPTAAALARTDVPVGVDGVSLAGVVQGRGSTGRDTLFWAYPHHIAGSHPHAAVRQGRYKLVRQLRDGRDELYDLRTDPGEADDLAERDPRRRARLGRLLTPHLAELDLFAPPLGADAYPRPAATAPLEAVSTVATHTLLRTRGPVESGRFALALATDRLIAEGSNRLFLGVAADADNHLLVRYNHRLRRVGWELRADGRDATGATEPLATLDGSLDLSGPGARLGFALRGSQVTAYADQGSGSWEMLFRFDVGGVLDLSDPARRRRLGFALGAQVDPAADRVEGFEARLV